MKISKEEVNVRRLLTRCEAIAKGKEHEDEWRFIMFVKDLEGMIINLRQSSSSPSIDTMNNYQTRLDILKGTMNIIKADNLLEKSKAVLLAPKGSQCDEAKDIHKLASEKTDSQVREKLFLSEAELRKRNVPTSSEGRAKLLDLKDRDDSSEDLTDVDALLKYHNNMQEKIADNMLELAKSIKQQSRIAGDIIRKDSDKIRNSTVAADRNISKLKENSEKLQEASKSSWQCWIAVLIVVVLMIFVYMVMLMKLFKKKK